jgi:hypothetical protein
MRNIDQNFQRGGYYYTFQIHFIHGSSSEFSGDNIKSTRFPMCSRTRPRSIKPPQPPEHDGTTPSLRQSVLNCGDRSAHDPCHFEISPRFARKDKAVHDVHSLSKATDRTKVDYMDVCDAHESTHHLCNTRREPYRRWYLAVWLRDIWSPPCFSSLQGIMESSSTSVQANFEH